MYTFPTRYLPPRSSVATQDSSPAKVFTVAESPIQHPEIKRTRLRLVQGGSTSHRKCERPGGYGYLPCSLMAAEGIELNAVRCAQDLPGARQSPLGDNEPPAETFGPFGIAERLN